jgi:hypothetical protein
MRHCNYEFSFAPDNRGDDLLVKDSSFRVVPGLANPGAVSFESNNFPNYFSECIKSRVAALGN